MKVCRNCGAEYSTGGYKYCEPCRPLMGKAQSCHWGRKKRAIESAARKADRPWTMRTGLVCWLEKECAGCGQQKPRSAYKAGKAKSPDGLESACLECESRRRSCRYLFATEETKRRTREALRKWRRSDAGKAFRAKQRKNPEHEKSYRRKRLERLARQDDGTVTGAILRKEFARTHCPYCAGPMHTKDKQLDHMQPLSLGGMHSACNVLVCCATCNTTKRNSPLTEWLSTLRPEQEAQCRALWIKRNGAPPEQQGLMLVDLGVVTRKTTSLRDRVTREAVAEANRARAAWFKRDAPDEWVTAYWEGMGQPWRNTRLTDGQQYKARYDNDEDFRRREIARQHAYKSRNRTPCKGKRIVIGRRFGKGGSISVA